MLRTASIPSNWSSSSNHVTAQYPRVNFTPLSFSGSSAPRNTMRCPVGRYVISIGEMRARNHRSSPSSAIAHVTCWNTESRSVLLNLRTITAFASGRARRRRTMHTLMNELFVEPLPPCSQ